MNISYRPMTAKQRSELQGLVAFSTQALRALLFVATIGFVAYFLRAVQLSIDVTFPFWVVVTVLLGLWLFIKSKAWTGGPGFRRLVREDLHQDRIRITEVVVQRCVEFSEEEDEGPGFFIETPEGESILFTGQYLDPAKRRGFPWKKFEIQDAPNSGYFFRIRKLGDSVAVDSVNPALSYELKNSLGCFQHNYIRLNDEQRANIIGE